MAIDENTQPKRVWTEDVLENAEVVVTFGTYPGMNLPDSAKRLAKKLMAHFAEHSSLRGLQVEARHEMSRRCVFCGHEYEERQDEPVCCERAVAEAQKEAA